MFGHKRPAVICAMRNLTSGLFKHLEITSTLDVDKIVSYAQILLRGLAPNKQKTILAECKETAQVSLEISGILARRKM